MELLVKSQLINNSLYIGKELNISEYILYNLETLYTISFNAFCKAKLLHVCFLIFNTRYNNTDKLSRVCINDIYSSVFKFEDYLIQLTLHKEIQKCAHPSWKYNSIKYNVGIQVGQRSASTFVKSYKGRPEISSLTLNMKYTECALTSPYACDEISASYKF